MGGGDANVAGNNDGDNSKNNENSAAAACGSDGEAVNINIRCSNGSKFSVQATLDSSVGSFKSILAQHCDIPSEQQRLIYKGRILKDEQTLDSYGTSMITYLSFSFRTREMIGCRCLSAIQDYFPPTGLNLFIDCIDDRQVCVPW